MSEDFVFQHKTAYEVRISDWSSDVCTSDLNCGSLTSSHWRARPRPSRDGLSRGRQEQERGRQVRARHRSLRAQNPSFPRCPASGRRDIRRPRRKHAWRSEEHTSELQSLMRISYAVFCLKKKKTPPTSPKRQHTVHN